MKIGIDCRTILNPHGGELAGVGHYTYFLVKALLDLDHKNTYVLFFDDRFKDFSVFKRENVQIRTFPFYQYKKFMPLLYSQLLVSALLDKEKLAVFHAPANTAPLFYNKPLVVTIHDLAIYKYPDFFPPQILNRQVFSTKVLVPKTLERAKKIIAVSKNTKTDIIEQFGIPEERIKVIYEGAINLGKNCPDGNQLAEIRKKYGIGEKYLLYLGTIEPRKNITALIKAFRNLYMSYDSPAKGYQLIIAGGRGWKDEPVYKAIADANASILGINQKRSGQERRSGIDKRTEQKKKTQGERRQSDRRISDVVKHIGYVSHTDKLCLLANAACFVFPSLYEGFGLPVLEAISLGTPVITSNLSSLPEIITPETGILVNPNKESELIEAMTQILGDEGLREEMGIKGRERAKEFTWEKCARETLEAYEEAVGGKL